MKHTQTTGAGTTTAALYNNDSALWRNYGRAMAPQSPSKFVSLRLHPDGDVSNGIQFLARFASRALAIKTLIEAGWIIDGDVARFAA